MESLFGMGRFLRFIARRERVKSLVWLLAIVGISMWVAAVFRTMFPGLQELMEMATMLNNPAMQALLGPVYGVEALTPSILMAQEMLICLIIAVAIMNIFFVIRHTRGDEELGRLEMFRSLPVGRLTGAASTLSAAFILNTVMALGIAGSLLLVNLSGTTVAGAFVYGFAIGISGFMFASLALLGAQLFSTARGSLTFSFAVFGLFYLLRAAGDVSDNILSLISPMGLGLKTYTFYENNVWPLWIILAEAFVLGLAALAICARRDLGEGVIPARTGRKNASPLLRSPLGLAWRLVRGSVLAWCIGLFVMGAVYGSVLGQISDFVEKNEMFKKLIESGAANGANLMPVDVANSFIAMILLIMAMFATVPIITTAMKLHGEEKRGRLEPVFARSVWRWEMMGSYALIAAIESAVLLFLGSLGMYAASASTGLVTFGGVLKAGMVYLPAVWSVLGLSLLLVGLLPKVKALIWLVLGYSFFTLYFGKLFDVPEWYGKLTPYGHIPQLPLESFEVLPACILTAIAVVLAGLGIFAFAERDVGRV